MNVFIYGDKYDRVKRVIEEHRVPDYEAEAHVKKRDNSAGIKFDDEMLVTKLSEIN